MKKDGLELVWSESGIPLFGPPAELAAYLKHPHASPGAIVSYGPAVMTMGDSPEYRFVVRGKIWRVREKELSEANRKPVVGIKITPETPAVAALHELGQIKNELSDLVEPINPDV